jgi:antitoxin (DNA-binding transcriptional repressor) of toxin-antitoxin stability system
VPAVAKRITATKAARELSDILDRVEHAGDEFVVERHGRAVASIAPVRGRVRGISGQDLTALLASLPRPDAAFVSEMRRIRRQQPRPPSDPWARSSTRRS